jgi:hypothetical protein
VGYPGFVLSHPCDRKKSQGWGTQRWWFGRKKALPVDVCGLLVGFQDEGVAGQRLIDIDVEVETYPVMG